MSREDLHCVIADITAEARAIRAQRDELINEVEQVALALDALFSYERGLDPYIDALYAAIQKAGAA